MHELNKTIPISNDKKKVKYELLWSDNQYSVLIDGTEKHRGIIAADFKGSASIPEFIDDLNSTKPEDWDDTPYIFEEDVKQELERTPEMINDPTEVPPVNPKSDWKPTLVTNPEYLRLQSLRRVNPAY